MFAVVHCGLRFGVMIKFGRRAVAALAIVAATPLASCDPTSKLLYRGDGTFSDRTELNRPRYVIRFNEIPIFQTGTYSFHFRGLPHEKMTLVLHVEGASPKQNEGLNSLHTAIEAALIDRDGNDLCKSSKQSGLNEKNGAWVLSSGPGDRDPIFWHWQCHNFQAYRLVSCN
jgi:hypothetical protein